MTRSYSTLSREILVILKRGRALTKQELFNSCCMASKEQISEQLDILIRDKKIKYIPEYRSYELITPEKTLPQIVSKFIHNNEWLTYA